MKLQDYRVQAGMSITDVSRASKVNDRTIRKAERGERVQAYKISQIINAINAVTGKSYTLNDFEEIQPMY